MALHLLLRGDYNNAFVCHVQMTLALGWVACDAWKRWLSYSCFLWWAPDHTVGAVH